MDQELISVKDIKVSYQMSSKKKGNFFSFNKKKKKHVALKKMSFDIYPGEILGVIGKNGSGKTTLLRVLAGTINPDSGHVDMGSRRVSLLGVNSSMMSELSGHDNIYLIGLQLGFSKADIKEQYDAIVAFAELEKFIHQPVRTYSSGMRSKLSFSIAVHLVTEVLLIDELLSVGDLTFRKKSYAKMKELIKDKNHTVVIVSHDLGRLQNLCNRVLWLDQGRLRVIGNPKYIIAAYRKQYTESTKKVLISELDMPDLLEVRYEDNKLIVTWAPVPDATGYFIYRRTETSKYSFIGQILGAMSDRYEDKKVKPGMTYQYTVRAFRSFNGVRDNSSIQAEGIVGTVPDDILDKVNDIE